MAISAEESGCLFADWLQALAASADQVVVAHGIVAGKQ